jgi:uncharacterized protein (DUF488 family)
MSGPKAPRSPDLFTLGYEKRTLEEFLALLQEARIDVVVDVRDTPWSHKPGFSKRPLSERVTRAGMSYVHAGFAGNPKSLRSAAKDNDEALRLYAEHLGLHPEILDQLDALLGPLRSQGKRACMICFERHPRDCHRGILAEAWARPRGIGLRHLATESAAG